MSGSRKDEYIQARQNLGITKEVVCLQQTPQGDIVVVYVEARDTSRVLQDMMEATDPFHQWFCQAILLDTHGIDSSQQPPPPNEVFLDLL